jgi:hypothetical protein
MFGKNKIVRSQAWLSGLQTYAETGGEESLTAQVELTEFRVRPASLPLLVTGGAGRLFSTLRTEPRYVEPFMTLVADIRGALGEAQELSELRVRDHVGDPAVLAMGGDSLLAEAEVAGIVPVLEHQLQADADASAAMTLRIRSSGPSVMLTFHGGPKNPLISIATWTATIEECARSQDIQEFVPPTLSGLRALIEAWERVGNPQGYREGYEVEQLVAAETIAGVTNETAIGGQRSVKPLGSLDDGESMSVRGAALGPAAGACWPWPTSQRGMQNRQRSESVPLALGRSFPPALLHRQRRWRQRDRPAEASSFRWQQGAQLGRCNRRNEVSS